MVSTTLGIIFFNESTSIAKFVGILLVLAAIISLNYKNAILEKNHFFGIAAGLLFGIVYTLDKGIVFHVNPLIYIMWTFVLISFWAFLLKPKEIISAVNIKKITNFKFILISAFFYFIFNIATFNPYVFGGEVGKIDAINNSQVFLIILFEFFILKHRQSIGRKLITAVIAYSGIVLLGFLY